MTTQVDFLPETVWSDISGHCAGRGFRLHPPWSPPSHPVHIQLVDDQRERDWEYGTGHKWGLRVLPRGGSSHFLPHSNGQIPPYNHDLPQGMLGNTDYIWAQEEDVEKVNVWPACATHLQQSWYCRTEGEKSSRWSQLSREGQILMEKSGHQSFLDPYRL